MYMTWHMLSVSEQRPLPVLVCGRPKYRKSIKRKLELTLHMAIVSNPHSSGAWSNKLWLQVINDTYPIKPCMSKALIGRGTFDGWDILAVTIGQFTIQFSLSTDIFSDPKTKVIETNCNTSVTDWQQQKTSVWRTYFFHNFKN